MFIDQRLNIVKMATLLKLIYRFNAKIAAHLKKLTR